MASLHPPVPSARLIRFLRLQSESLSLFGPSHGNAASLGQATQKICAAKKQQRYSLRVGCAIKSSPDASLQASFLDLDSLIRCRRYGPSKSARQKSLPYFAQNMGVRYSSSDKPPTPTQSPPTPTQPEQLPAPAKPIAAKKSLTWREILWGCGAKKKGKPLEPNDLPDVEGGENNSMFSSRRQLSQKAALEPRLRCTEVDEHGNVILVDGEFKKSELIARVCWSQIQ